MVLLAFSFWGFVKSVLMLVFVLSSLLLMLVVLLQEPKGGGLSSAFGGAGAETFGVQTGSVNKFTAWVAIVFMGTAILYAAIDPGEGPSVADRATPAVTGDGEPAEGGAGAGDQDGK